MTNPINKITLEERFWSKVVKGNHCWLWNVARKKKGYGLMIHWGKPLHAHRVSYELHYGLIPKGMLVMHKCDNPPCVNPEHLFLGTHQDNVDDMIREGRSRPTLPEKCWTHKLNWILVREMRELRRSTKMTIGEIANLYDISRGNASKIFNNQIWVEKG